MRVIFMGTPEFAVPTLAALLDSEYPVVGVVTQPDRPRGRGKSVTASPVKELALAHQIPLLQPEKMKQPEFLSALEAWHADLIVVAAFGRILPKAILDLPPRGCVNVHSSLLPKYRGAGPIQWAIINGETETGITTMLMDEGMDTGPILLQEKVSIREEDTAKELSDRLAHVGGQLLVRTLRLWEAKDIVPLTQEHSGATMAPMLRKEDGVISWAQSAETIGNRIRGLSPWPGAFTFCRQDRLMIWKARPYEGQTDSLSSGASPGTIVKLDKQGIFVQTGDGILHITELQMANRKRMTVGQFLAGYSLECGMQLRSEPM
ncbi:MAG: methionyl-tRNA formyltransferase [Nitrospirales bacterium]|nr:methionyl-tRNA formyltransferase [Nitrospira sp.]MDR4501247.1 methionyl-tRNA formyltransferase [Nitrospirales bacterium]